MENKQQNVFRAFLRSELTWGVFLLSFLWGIVTTIVLPLQKLQIQVSQIQSDLVQTKVNYETALAEHADLTNRITVIETEIKPLIK